MRNSAATTGLEGKNVTLIIKPDVRTARLSPTGSMVMSSTWRTTMSRFTQYHGPRRRSYRHTSDEWDGRFPERPWGEMRLLVLGFAVTTSIKRAERSRGILRGNRGT